MRRVFACLLIALAGNTFASEVDLVRVWPQWQDAEAFDRIGEYFGRGEDRSGSIVRTHPEQRAGLYFLVRVKTPAPVTDAGFVLEIIRPDAPDPKQFTFPVSLPAGGGVVQLGLTDGDWPGGRDVHPVAWRLTLRDRTSAVLAEKKSFLWEKPAQ